MTNYTIQQDGAGLYDIEAETPEAAIREMSENIVSATDDWQTQFGTKNFHEAVKKASETLTIRPFAPCECGGHPLCGKKTPKGELFPCWAIEQGGWQFLTLQDCRNLAEFWPGEVPLLEGCDSAEPEIWAKAAAAGLDTDKYGVIETRCAGYRSDPGAALQHSAHAYGPIVVKSQAGVACKSCGYQSEHCDHPYATFECPCCNRDLCWSCSVHCTDDGSGNGIITCPYCKESGVYAGSADHWPDWNIKMLARYIRSDTDGDLARTRRQVEERLRLALK